MLFFELIQVALGKKDCLTKNPSEQEWKAMLDMAKKQAVVGIAFLALNKLTEIGQKPPLSLLYEWIGLSEQIKAQNKLVNSRCIEVSKLFAGAGFRSCILKGQGNALMYSSKLRIENGKLKNSAQSDSLAMLRQPGDIDIWVDASKEDVVDYVRKQFPIAKVREHHVEYPLFKDVEVEVHFRPVSAVSVRYDKRLDSYFHGQKDAQFQHSVILPDIAEGINVPTVEFNVVYQMAHMMKHFFSEGLGLRHLMDYYNVLTSDEIQKEKDYTRVFQELGLLRFAKAVMWVLGSVFLLSGNRMVCDPDERRGILLFQEIMAGGNFGHRDERFARRLMTKSSTLSILIRNSKLFWLFPEESISAPVSNVIRRLKNG